MVGQPPSSYPISYPISIWKFAKQRDSIWGPLHCWDGGMVTALYHLPIDFSTVYHLPIEDNHSTIIWDDVFQQLLFSGIPMPFYVDTQAPARTLEAERTYMSVTETFYVENSLTLKISSLWL